MIVEVEEMMGTEYRPIEPGGEGQTKAKESDKVLRTGIKKSSFLQQVVISDILFQNIDSTWQSL